MNVVVNGASGYIGYHLTKKLIESGNKVYALYKDKLNNLSMINPDENLKIINVSQTDISQELCDKKIDVWFQLAWNGASGSLRINPYKQVENELMSIESMKIAETIGCKKIIFTGTIYENLLSCILADEKFNNSSFYIMAKNHTHELTLQMSKNMNIKYVWVQFCHPVGEYMNENQFIPYAVKAFMTNEDTEFGKCDQYYDIVSVHDLADALILLGQSAPKKNYYFVGSEKPKLLKDYLSEAAEICGYKKNIGFGKRADDGLIFEKQWFDISEFSSEFGWKPKYKFNDIIEELISYFREGTADE